MLYAVRNCLLLKYGSLLNASKLLFDNQTNRYIINENKSNYITMLYRFKKILFITKQLK